MGSAGSKAARKLPKNVASATHPSPAVPRPPPEAFTPPPPSEQPAQSTGTFDYGAAGAAPSRPAPAQARDLPERHPLRPQFSGEKDANILKDGMDPQFLAKLQQLGPVDLNRAEKLVRAPVRAQRTLAARRDEYTNPSATPPAGTVTAQMLGHLLDTLKTLPAGADPTPYYQQYNLTAEDLAGVRRWINSPSVSEETVARVDDAQAQTMEQLVELKGVWIDAQDAGAPKR
ncbi:uncharacterized protein EHS24_006125 [Apiotrichum porosum]|uniref:Uncharacterized protein n=1 Tax=Apiotrichum porosum TaxID=105984 RepID=A0A427Y0G8_9TREE|nr:uncharacterized protein EHS24_006125 [Apiotrichum porosum]RSH84601.1 hypothetical protein EHS24_006125 [Apiotrichum porosum]